MRLTTILFMPSLSLRERFIRLRDWAAREFGARLPLRVRYWVTLQEVGRATMKSPNVPATPLGDVLQGLESPKVVS